MRPKIGDTMRFFSSQRRNAAPPPTAQPQRVLPAPAPQAGALPRPVPVLTDTAILAYLDGSFEGAARRTARPGRLDLMQRVLELTNSDWSEDEAAAELAWLAAYDRRVLEALGHRLIAGLVRNPLPDVCGVLASRVASRSLQHCAPTGEDRRNDL